LGGGAHLCAGQLTTYKAHIMFRAAFATTLLAAVPAAAQVSTNPAAANSATYSVEPSHTRVLFSVNHMGFTTWYGNFSNASGTLKLNVKHPADSSVTVTIPTASVTTTNAKLDSELVAADWFDAAKYPTFTFASTKVTPTGHGTAKVEGNLTLHGVTKPVVLNAKFNAGGTNPLDHVYTVGFDATTSINRSDFGVSKYIPLVGNDVNITISAAFEQK
jgi:polyisoprenoid-binding protein YceI